MAKESRLAEIAVNCASIVVDGERADSLQPKREVEPPRYVTSETIARREGMKGNSPKYSGLHHHCQYARTC